MKMLKWMLVLSLMAAPLYGQSASKSLDRIAREQQNIRQRLENIHKKMDRLARKSELEGKEHTAELIRRARVELEKRDVVKRIEELDARIRASQLTVGEEQAVLLRDLEDVFAILQDRNDLERLEDILASYMEGLAKIGNLIEEQDDLLAQTRELVYEESTLRASNQERLEKIIEGQKELLSRVEKSARQAEADEGCWALTDSLERLALEQEGLMDEISARMEAGETESADLAERQDGLEKKLNEALKHDEAQAEAREPLERARSAMESAGEHLEAKELKESHEQGDEVRKNLREAIDKLNQSGRSSRREQMLQSRDMAGHQDFLEQKMEELMSKMEVLERMTEGSSDQKGKELETSEEILGEMRNAEEQLKRGDPAGAEPSQSKALEKLEALKEMMERSESGASSSPSEELSQGERQERLQDLAKRQKELEERTRDLMRRMRELPDKKPVQELSNAADNMAGAAAELSQNEGEEAEVEEEEAKKYLERAKQEMLEEENKYQNIRQQEVLFRVLQALEELKTEQDAVHAATVEFDLTRGTERRVTRLMRKTLRTLAQRELDVRTKTDDVRQKVEEDDATVFSWVLERNVEDLDEVVESLNGKESGPLVQTVQKDVSERFGELIEAMKMELKRRGEAASQESGPQPQGNQPQQNPLIPPVAELLMIKKMEENALRRLTEFIRLHPDLMERGAGPMEAQMLERLGHRHVSITELFSRMLERAAQGGGMPGQEMEEEN